MAKVLNTRIQYKHDDTNNWNNCTDISLKGELYVHVSGTDLQLKVGDGTNQIRDLPYVDFNTDNAGGGESDSTKQVISSIPEQINIPTYDGTDKEPEWSNYDQAKMTIATGSVIKANQAGNYTVWFTPREGYCWQDGTVDRRDVNWNIKKANPNLQASPENIKLTPKIDTITVEITTVSSGEITFELADENIVAVTQSGTSLTVSTVDSGTTTLTVRVAESPNYNSAAISIEISCKAKLNDYSWQEISDLAKTGEAHNIFQVGDIKEVFLNGEVATARGTNFTVTNGNIPTYVYISNIATTQTSTGSYDILTFTGFLQQLDTMSNNLYSVCINNPQQDLFVGFDYSNGNISGSDWYSTLSSLKNIFHPVDNPTLNPGLIDNIMCQSITPVRLCTDGLENYKNTKDYPFYRENLYGSSHSTVDFYFTAGGRGQGYSQYQENGNIAGLYYINGDTQKTTKTIGRYLLSGEDVYTGETSYYSKAYVKKPGDSGDIYDTKNQIYMGWPPAFGLSDDYYGGICPSFKIGGPKP